MAFRAPTIKRLDDFQGNVVLWCDHIREVLQSALNDLERHSVARDRAAQEPYVVTNATPLRTLDASTATLGQTAQALATLLQDLGKRRVLKVPE